METQTGWTSEQLEHRVKRYQKLASTPTKEDLEAVATKLLAREWNDHEREWNEPGPRPLRDFVKMVVGYALTCKMRLPAVAATVEEARYQARKSGRSHIVAADIRTAVFDYQIPSDQALQRLFDSEKHRAPLGATNGSGSAVAPFLQRRCEDIASSLQSVR